MNSLITLTTDLGDQFAVAQLHAVLAQDGFDGQIIENHSVTPFSILEGAFEIDALSRFTPTGTIHVGVVDPGVGSDRRGVIIKTKSFWFVGPDNGLLYPAAVRDGIRQVWQIDESAFGNVTNTFHGRDVFIRAAVKFANSDQPEQFGCSLTSPTSLTPLTFHPGQVVHVDHYGNLKVIWENGIHVGSSLRIKKNGQSWKIPVVKTFSDVPEGAPLALLGSNGTLELAVNLGKADEYFGVQLGDIVRIRSLMRDV